MLCQPILSLMSSTETKKPPAQLKLLSLKLHRGDVLVTAPVEPYEIQVTGPISDGSGGQVIDRDQWNCWFLEVALQGLDGWQSEPAHA